MKCFNWYGGVAISALLALTGCNKAEQQTAQDKAQAAADKTGAAIKDAYNDTKAAMGRAWDNVKGYTYEKRSDFDAHAKAVSADMDVQVAKLRTEYSEAKASASRKAAMEELKTSEADYKEKLRALGGASADTWEASKQNVILAWEKLEASYRRARAD